MADVPHRIPGAAFERPKLFLSNLTTGDVEGATRALLSPETLAPSQARTLAEKWGVVEPGDDSWFSKILRMAENPLILIGLILSIRHPIPLAKNLFKYSPSLTGLARKPGILMRMVGGVDELYHGIPAGRTTLPEAYKAVLRDVEQFTREHTNRLAEAITKYEVASGRQFNKRTGYLLASKLEGADEAGGILRRIQEGPAFDALHTDARRLLDDLHDKVLSYIETKGLTKIERRQIFEQLRNSGIGIPSGPKLAKYYPHRIMRDLATWERESQAMIAASSERGMARQAAELATRVSSVHALPRHNQMVINPDQLKEISDYLIDPSLPQQIKMAMKAKPGLKNYSLDFEEVMTGYIHSLARAWGWTLRGHGSDIMKGVKALEESGAPHNIARAMNMRSSYIPIAMGRSTFKQFLSAAQWDSTRISMVDGLTKGKLKDVVPTGVKDWLVDSLVKDRGMTSLRRSQGRMASWLYLGALGGNPMPAAWNLLQTILTTQPLIGSEATYQGVRTVWRKAGKYFQSRLSGVPHDIALLKAYPEFSKAGLHAAPVSEEALASAWEASAHLIPRKGLRTERARAALMSLFQTSETINRLVAFEGTMWKGVKEGLTMAEVEPIARRATEATQFLGGPANIPAMFRESGSLLRQFGTFPARLLEYIIGPATEVGSGAQAGGLFGLFPKRNLGTLGRMMLTSTLAYEAGREILGQDISRGLLFGALPQPVPGAPFYPIPFVPPVLGIAGGAAQALYEGTSTPLLRQLPIMVPGGLAMARASTVASPEVARFFGRQFADYDNKDDQGRIPIYLEREGRLNLRGYMTPMQLYMEALGFPPGGTGALQQERELERYLLAQRDRIRLARSEFLTAIVQNDVRKATQIREEYERLYPGLQMQIRPQDLRAVHLRMQIPRIEKTLETMPKDVRPLFGQVISAALLQEAEGLIGVDPLLLQIPGSTILQREIYRKTTPTNVIEELYQQRLDRKQALPRPPRPMAPIGVMRGPPTGTGARREAGRGMLPVRDGAVPSIRQDFGGGF